MSKIGFMREEDDEEGIDDHLHGSFLRVILELCIVILALATHLSHRFTGHLVSICLIQPLEGHSMIEVHITHKKQDAKCR